jgi:hypothetical protein
MATATTTHETAEPIELVILPGMGEVTPEEAARWLEEDAKDWLYLAADNADRGGDASDGVSTLALDLAALIPACIRSVRTGQPFEVHAIGPGTPDGREAAERLMPALVAGEPAAGLGAYDALREHLAFQRGILAAQAEREGTVNG